MTLEECETLLADCEKRSEKLTPWECNFVDSLSRQLAEGRRPSEKQCSLLESLWEKATEKG